MAHFDKGPNLVTPFGDLTFLRSTHNYNVESYTLGMASVPTVTIDGVAQQVLYNGTAMATMTSGAESGKVGPIETGDATGRAPADTANFVGVSMTYVPWQAMRRDVEIGVVYQGVCILANCWEVDVSGDYATLTQGVADGMRSTSKLDLLFV